MNGFNHAWGYAIKCGNKNDLKHGDIYAIECGYKNVDMLLNVVTRTV
jgi:hypothetical protein